MSTDNYTFNGVPFLAVVSNGGETPHFALKVEATDRKLIGTDRFERSVRSSAYAMEIDAWIEPTDSAAADAANFAALQAAYKAATLALLVSPGGTASACIILSFAMAPLRGGVDGYRGKVTFGLPGGRG